MPTVSVLFSTLIFHDQKFCKFITYRHWIGDSWNWGLKVCDSPRQKISCLLQVVARCLLLSAIQCTVNHWFYITVSNMCKQLEELQSLPRNTMHKRGLCHHAVSVCLSVTFVDHVKMNRHIVKIFSPSGGHTILVFPYQMGWQYSDGNPPYGGVKCRWGRQKSRFWAYIWL